MAKLRRRHAGQLGLIINGRRERGISGQPLKSHEFAVRQYAKKVNDSSAVGIIHAHIS